MSHHLHLCPRPRALTVGEGVYHLQPNQYILLDDAGLYESVRIAAARHPLTAALRVSVNALPARARCGVRFTHLETLVHEGYSLSVTNEGVTVCYGDAAGAFYAMCTLVQIIENVGGTLPVLDIQDKPAFPTRGYMWDIGRNKIPTREEMFTMVDWLASMKVNHVELYIEGIPFEYPSFPHMWDGKEVLTGEDVLALDAYCKARFIDLVPTQNHFGHMDQWLYKEYRHLAECPDGFTFQGGRFPHPRCLNPLDPASEELVRTLENDLLPYFSSSQFNICCDETLELGQGHAKEACEAQGLGRVYLDFLQKVIAIAREHGKSVLFWDDIIRHYPELLPELPKDAIALDWGYLASEPHEEDCATLHEKGVRFFVCPGTGAWNTLLGKTNQMVANIRNAAEYGQKYGAEGLLNTDWGDSGHLQSLPTSYSGICYGAAMAWSPAESLEMDLAGMLDTLVFKDAARVMGQLVLDAGNYFEEENTKPNNITLAFLMLISGLDAGHVVPEGEDFAKMHAFLGGLRSRLSTVDLHCERAALILDEYALAINLIDFAEVVGEYHYAVKAADAAAQAAALERILAEVPALIGEIKRTWLLRNRYSYLDESLQPLYTIRNQATAKLSALKAQSADTANG